MYSRADSWLDWNGGQNEDRVLASLCKILAIGLKSLFAIPGALIQTAGRQGRRAQFSEAGQTIAPFIAFFFLALA